MLQQKRDGTVANVCWNHTRKFRKQFLKHLADVERGDPEATAEAILKLVDAENPPLRLGLGTSILPRARAAFAERLETWEAWEDVSNAAMGEPKKSMAAWMSNWPLELWIRNKDRINTFH